MGIEKNGLFLCLLSIDVVLTASSLGLLIFILTKTRLRETYLCCHVMSGLTGLLLHGDFYLPLANMNYVTGWKLGRTSCHMFQLVRHFTLLHLPFTLASVAVDRSIFLSGSGLYNRERPMELLTLALVVASWLTSGGLSATVVYGMDWPLVKDTNGSLRCALSMEEGDGEGGEYASFLSPRLGLVFYLPVCLNLLLSLAVLASACRQRYLGEGQGHVWRHVVLVWVPPALYCAAGTVQFVVSKLVPLNQTVVLREMVSVYYSFMPLTWMILFGVIRKLCCCLGQNKYNMTVHPTGVEGT